MKFIDTLRRQDQKRRESISKEARESLEQIRADLESALGDAVAAAPGGEKIIQKLLDNAVNYGIATAHEAVARREENKAIYNSKIRPAEAIASFLDHGVRAYESMSYDPTDAGESNRGLLAASIEACSEIHPLEWDEIDKVSEGKPKKVDKPKKLKPKKPKQKAKVPAKTLTDEELDTWWGLEW